MAGIETMVVLPLNLKVRRFLDIPLCVLIRTCGTLIKQRPEEKKNVLVLRLAKLDINCKMVHQISRSHISAIESIEATISTGLKHRPPQAHAFGGPYPIMLLPRLTQPCHRCHRPQRGRIQEVSCSIKKRPWLLLCTIVLLLHHCVRTGAWGRGGGLFTRCSVTYWLEITVECQVSRTMPQTHHKFIGNAHQI